MTLIGRLLSAVVSATIFLIIGILLFSADIAIFDSQAIFSIFGLLVIVFTLLGEYTLISL